MNEDECAFFFLPKEAKEMRSCFKITVRNDEGKANSKHQKRKFFFFYKKEIKYFEWIA